MFKSVSLRVCRRAVGSRVDAKGQQLVRVEIVEGAQVRQAQEELGEESGVIGAVASDQRPQPADQALLELLHSLHV